MQNSAQTCSNMSCGTLGDTEGCIQMSKYINYKSNMRVRKYTNLIRFLFLIISLANYVLTNLFLAFSMYQRLLILKYFLKRMQQKVERKLRIKSRYKEENQNEK